MRILSCVGRANGSGGGGGRFVEKGYTAAAGFDTLPVSLTLLGRLRISSVSRPMTTERL